MPVRVSAPRASSTALVDANPLETEYQWIQFEVSLTCSTKKEIKPISFINYLARGKVLIYDLDYHIPDLNVLMNMISRLGLPTNLNIVAANDLNNTNKNVLKQSS